MTDNQTTELQEILDDFEHDCFMMRVEASETGAKDYAVRMSYDYIRNKYIKRIYERYMKLPEDIDGVPIHVGDWMIADEGEQFNVCAVAPARIHAWCKRKIGDNGPSTVQYVPGRIKHYKPRTLEDLLEELVRCAMIPEEPLDRGDIEGFADEIRRMFDGEW